MRGTAAMVAALRKAQTPLTVVGSQGLRTSARREALKESRGEFRSSSSRALVYLDGEVFGLSVVIVALHVLQMA